MDDSAQGKFEKSAGENSPLAPESMKFSFSWRSKVFGSGYGWSRGSALRQRHCRPGRRAKVCGVCSFPPDFHPHARPPLGLRMGTPKAVMSDPVRGWAAAE